MAKETYIYGTHMYIMAHIGKRYMVGPGASPGVFFFKGGPGASPGVFRFSGGSTAPARVSLYIPMCSGVRPDQIIVPLYKGAWSDRTTLLSR